ncbi:MAG: hypothetical protein II484_04065 [Bacteroidaceae bacterium]|nr:hypothetical protein [Bacteroidaceae bacterium]
MPKQKKTPLIRILISIRRWELLLLVGLLLLGALGYALYNRLFANTSMEIVDSLGGNIFPSAILATATSDENFILPCDTPYVGTPSSLIGVKVHSRTRNTRIRVEVAETPFFRRSVSEFVLPRPWTEYVVYPDIVWNYGALRANVQATPVSVVIQAQVGHHREREKVRTFSVRSINECLLGYYRPYDNGKQRRFIDRRQLFAAYVNEDNPQIDQVLREALNTRIVNRFVGYQGDSATVVRQVYALWNVLQRRGFKYSSISNSSLSSGVVAAQRVRTFDDALASSQINCLDGSVLMASLMRAINIVPILVRLPRHMFVGFYTDREMRHANYLETTMVGNVNLDDYFPDEKLDSTMAHRTKNEASLLTFNKAMEYAQNNMRRYDKFFKNNTVGYTLLPITSEVRRKIQPIGK